MYGCVSVCDHLELLFMVLEHNHMLLTPAVEDCATQYSPLFSLRSPHRFSLPAQGQPLRRGVHCVVRVSTTADSCTPSFVNTLLFSAIYAVQQTF